MIDYVRWSLWQFYLLVFWPTQFRREIEDVYQLSHGPQMGTLSRFKYQLKLLPWMIAFALATNYVLQQFDAAQGGHNETTRMIFGVALGIGLGFVLGLKFGVGCGIPATSMFGVTFGAAVLVGNPTGSGVIVGAGSAITLRVALTSAVGLRGNNFGPSLIEDWFEEFKKKRRTLDYDRYMDVPAVLLPPLLSLAFGGAYFAVIFGVVGTLIGAVSGLPNGAEFGSVAGAAFIFEYFVSAFRLTFYGFELTVNWLISLIAHQWPELASWVWRFQPGVWDQLPYFPLPFTASHLAVIIRHNRSLGLQQLAWLTAERPNERRASLAVNSEVAIAEIYVEALRELAQVSERLNWSDDSPADLPEDVRSALPRFRRISEHVAQFEELSSQDRQRGALQRANEELEQLRRSLAGSGGRFAARLLSAANRWSELIGEELDRLSAARAESRLLPNPFVFGNPVGERFENVFMGRRDIVQQLEASVLGSAHPPTLLLYGPRRMGKSSILKQLPKLLGPDFAVADIDCQRPAVTESSAGLLAMMTRAISAGIKRWQIDIIPLGRNDFGDAPFGVFDDWLQKVEQAVEARSSDSLRILWCLDEFERLQESLDAGWGGKVLDQLRHTLQHRPLFVLLFCGSHTFEEQGPAWTDRFISARRLRVSFLPREDLLPLLTQPCEGFDLTYEPGALDAALDATAGQPFLTQAVGFELVQYLNEDERKVASVADIEEAVKRALITGSEYFADLWNTAGPNGQSVLNTISRGEPAPNDASAIRKLTEHDVLDAEQRFIVPMVERWVRSRD